MLKLKRHNLISIVIALAFAGCTQMGHQKTPAERSAEQNASLIQVLNNLIQLDIDTYHAYTQAIEGIKEKHIKENLLAFRTDHERHIGTLSTHVLQLGGTPTSFTRDFKGFLITGYTAFKRGSGTDGALKAMQSNENISNKIYAEAMSVNMPPQIKADVRKNLEDEKRHLNTINQFIAERSK